MSKLRNFYYTNKWKKTRLIVLERDFYICQKCFENAATVVHHKIELTEENLNDLSIALGLDNLISFCRDCHEKHHGRLIEDEDNIYEFDENGYIVPKVYKVVVDMGKGED